MADIILLSVAVAEPKVEFAHPPASPRPSEEGPIDRPSLPQPIPSGSDSIGSDSLAS